MSDSEAAPRNVHWEPVGLSPLHERLLAASGGRSFRVLAEVTGSHPESVRRYMQGQSPSAEFLSAFCRQLGINGDWLLTGRGPMRTREIRGSVLAEAGAGDLMGAMVGQLEGLIARMDRVEVFVQALDVRVRSAGVKEGPDNGQAAAELPERVRVIAGALPQRSRTDVG